MEDHNTYPDFLACFCSGNYMKAATILDTLSKESDKLQWIFMCVSGHSGPTHECKIDECIKTILSATLTGDNVFKSFHFLNYIFVRSALATSEVMHRIALKVILPTKNGILLSEYLRENRSSAALIFSLGLQELLNPSYKGTTLNDWFWFRVSGVSDMVARLVDGYSNALKSADRRP